MKCIKRKIISHDQNISDIDSSDVRGILKVKVKLINKFGPLTVGQTGEKFYKYVFSDGSGQIDCIIDEEGGGLLAFDRLKVGRKYKLDKFQTISTLVGKSKDYNYSDHAFYIRNPRVRRTAQEIPGVEKFEHIQFEFTDLEDIVHMDQDTIVDIIGCVHDVGHTAYLPTGNALQKVQIRDSMDVDGKFNLITATVWKENIKNIPGEDTVVIFKNAKVNHDEYCLETTIYITQATQIFTIESRKVAQRLLQREQWREYRNILKLNRLPNKS